MKLETRGTLATVVAVSLSNLPSDRYWQCNEAH